jgi:hypothetical protein
MRVPVPHEKCVLASLLSLTPAPAPVQTALDAVFECDQPHILGCRARILNPKDPFFDLAVSGPGAQMVQADDEHQGARASQCRRRFPPVPVRVVLMGLPGPIVLTAMACPDARAIPQPSPRPAPVTSAPFTLLPHGIPRLS